MQVDACPVDLFRFVRFISTELPNQRAPNHCAMVFLLLSA